MLLPEFKLQAPYKNMTEKKEYREQRDRQNYGGPSNGCTNRTLD